MKEKLKSQKVTLALDTVSDGISVTLGDVFIKVEIPDKKMKDKMVNDVVKQAMNAAGLGFGDLDQYSVVVGPGSWTGARVGVAVIKAYCLAMDLPVIARTLDGKEKIVSGSELEPFYDKEFTVSTMKRSGLSIKGK